MHGRTLLMAFSVVLLSGCATPATRIREHPGIYAKATLAQQSLISQGRIALGFSPALVKLALGNPQRITERTDEKGTEIIWHYLDYRSVAPYSNYPYFPYCCGAVVAPWPPVVVVPNPQRDRLRVIFRHRRVVAIEQELEPP